jgi:HEAT repeat protein
VRQTAHLLGELRDPRADALLVELLQHPDARTRRIAVAALAHSEREDALGAVAFALNDESPLVRLRAVAALAGRREADVLRWLGELIDREADREVLFAAIGAIGAIATPEAVQTLIPIAAGEGENPLKRSAAMRIQACTALAIVRTPPAMAAVQLLRTDRDREVREASVRLVAQAKRRTTSTGMPAISAP